MAFEVSGAILAEGLIDTVAADAALELMPLAMESLAPEVLGSLAPEAFAGFGGETLSSLFGSEMVPAAIQQAATPMAESALAGGAGAGEGITAATKGALETGAATLPEAASPFAQTAPMLDYVEPSIATIPTPETVNPYESQFNEAFQNPDPSLNGPSPYEPTASTGQSPLVEKASSYTPDQLNEIARGQGVFPEGSNALPGSEVTGNASLPAGPPAPDSGFMEGFSNFVDKHPFMTGAGIYGIASATGVLNHNQQTLNNQNQNTYSSPYKFDSKNFKGSHPDPQPYQVNYSGYAKSNYADGGITQASPQTNFAKGGSLLQQLIDSAAQSGQPITQDDYLQAQGLHTSFNPDYYFDKANAKFVPTSSVSIPTPEASAPAPTSDGGGAGGGYAGGSMPDELKYASGGIAHYYRGNLATSTGGRNDVYGATQRFLDMYDPASKYEAPSGTPDVGIFHDTNPSTRDKSAYQASGIRNKAIANKAMVKTGANYMPPSRQMGQLNLNTPSAKADNDSDSDQVLTGASGGIMGASLGGYAAGGNPRLLRGPGDGMSDNIPATIGGRQPARLADGEFVVPADVVSHLGNGSTEAGAKRLHEMMNKVRVDRTGKKKQAPAVKADKYIPK